MDIVISAVCLQLYNEELFDLLDVTKDPVDKVINDCVNNINR